MKDNPLAPHDGLPAFDQVNATHVVPAIRTLLAQATADLASLTQTAKPDFDTVERLTDLSEPLTHAWGVVNHLMAVKNSQELREAHQAVQSDVVMFAMQLAQNQPLFNALQALKDDATAFARLGSAQRRTVEKHLLRATLAGLSLPADKRQELNALETALSETETRFANNVVDATKAFGLELTTPQQIAGLPHGYLQMAAAAARAHGQPNATAEQGPWRIMLDAPGYLGFMKHSQRRDLREQLYRAFITRASSGEQDNGPLIDRILEMRARKATMLGFASFAQLSLVEKMAPSVDEVERLLEELRTASWDAAKKDLAALQALSGSQPVALWDVEYLSERLREQRFAFTEEKLRPYFALPRVLDGLFALAQRLFGVTVERADGQAPVWHPDVMYFNMRNAAGTQVAAFYLDAYSRPENKRGGAWMDECVQRRRKPAHTQVRLPVAYLCCNQAPPVDGKPSLMTFREVETLFHEFGHGLQHMLTTVDCAEVAGIRGIEWDAVELPSQFMENWCYHKQTLLGLSHHVETGAQLPDELFDKIAAARTFRAASLMLRQIYFARVDLALHHHRSGGQPSVLEVQRSVAATTSLIPPLPEDRFLNGFTHIFAGGYAAGYYSYKWAEVLSADAFSAFEEAGLDNPQSVAETGIRFRDTVLALGGSLHPTEVFKSFRGREPSTAALLRHAGLAA